MAQATLRFAHAGNLRLDTPLSGVGRLSEAQRRIAEDAPVSAWQRVVETCIDRDVEFLLLTPHTGGRSWTSIDRRHLRDGFRELQEYGIRVFWAAADGDATAAEHPATWPDNVLVLAHVGESATVVREGRAIATISFGSTRSDADRLPEGAIAAAPTCRPVRILIPGEPGTVERLPAHGGIDVEAHAHPIDADCDYMAGWGASRWHTRKVASAVCVDPGTTQPRSAAESGGGGVSIVEWNGGQNCDAQRVPTATVRWERFVLGVTAETTPEGFAERMQLALLEREPAVGEGLWIVDWHIVGSGPLFGALSTESTRQELEQAANAAAGGDGRLNRVHRWDLRARGEGLSGRIGAPVLEWLEQQGELTWSAITGELVAELSRRDHLLGAACLPSISAAAARDAAERRLGAWLHGDSREAV